MRALALVVLACLIAAPAGAAEGWRLECDADDMARSNQRPEFKRILCRVYYVMRAPGGVVVLFVTSVSPSKPVIMIRAQEEFCVTPRTTIQVNQNRAITLERIGNVDVAPEPAAVLFEQLTEGSRVVVRVHTRPDCQPRDLELPLKGFAATWRRYEAEVN